MRDVFPRAALKRVAKLGTGHTPSRSHPEYWVDRTIPWLTLADVGPLRAGTLSVVTKTKEMISELGVANSSAVIHPAGTVAMSRTASVGFSAILGQDMATSQDYVTWTCGPDAEPRFVLHALRGLRDEILSNRMGSTHQTIYMPDVERIRIPLPSLDQQRRIASFLDDETTRIDALIAAKQQMVSTLSEARSAIIRRGVLGLDESASVRESRVPWAPHLPSHWADAKLTLLAQLGSGHTPSRSRPDWWLDRTVPWITTGEVAQMRSDRIEEISETREKLSELGIANSSAVVHPAGTVVLCRTAASAGYSAIMAGDMTVSQDIATWTCGPRLRPRYLLLCLRAMRRDLLERLAMGSTHKTIYMPDLESIRVPVPPITEQDAIVESVWRRLHQIDGITDTLSTQVGLLRERRQALITAAVTGEIEV